MSTNSFKVEYNKAELSSGTFTNSVGKGLELWCVADGVLTITSVAGSKDMTVPLGAAVSMGDDITGVVIKSGIFHLKG